MLLRKYSIFAVKFHEVLTDDLETEAGECRVSFPMAGSRLLWLVALSNLKISCQV